MTTLSALALFAPIAAAAPLEELFAQGDPVGADHTLVDLRSFSLDAAGGLASIAVLEDTGGLRTEGVVLTLEPHTHHLLALEGQDVPGFDPGSGFEPQSVVPDLNGWWILGRSRDLASGRDALTVWQSDGFDLFYWLSALDPVPDEPGHFYGSLHGILAGPDDPEPLFETTLSPTGASALVDTTGAVITDNDVLGDGRWEHFTSTSSRGLHTAIGGVFEDLDGRRDVVTLDNRILVEAGDPDPVTGAPLDHLDGVAVNADGVVLFQSTVDGVPALHQAELGVVREVARVGQPIGDGRLVKDIPGIRYAAVGGADTAVAVLLLEGSVHCVVRYRGPASGGPSTEALLCEGDTPPLDDEAGALTVASLKERDGAAIVDRVAANARGDVFVLGELSDGNEALWGWQGGTDEVVLMARDGGLIRRLDGVDRRITSLRVNLSSPDRGNGTGVNDAGEVAVLYTWTEDRTRLAAALASIDEILEGIDGGTGTGTGTGSGTGTGTGSTGGPDTGTGGTGTSTGAPGSGTGTGGVDTPEDEAAEDPKGCGCASASGGAGWLAGMLPLLALVRRRR